MTRGFCWHQNFVPWGCLPLTCGYIHLLNHEKRLKGFFVNLQQMTIVMSPTCWHQNFGPNGLSAPAQGLCLNVFSSITALILTYPQQSGERYRTNGPLVLVLSCCDSNETFYFRYHIYSGNLYNTISKFFFHEYDGWVNWQFQQYFSHKDNRMLIMHRSPIYIWSLVYIILERIPP